MTLTREGLFISLLNVLHQPRYSQQIPFKHLSIHYRECHLRIFFSIIELSQFQVGWHFLFKNHSWQ